MTITIGHTSDDRRKLRKSFIGSNITAQLKQPCDVLNPVFIISYNVGYMTCNYVQVPDFGRYYFISNINLLPGNRTEFSCSVDVLMTYADQISAINCVIARYEHAKLSEIADSNIMIKNYNIIDTYPLPNKFDVAFGSYVMEVIGGNS